MDNLRAPMAGLPPNVYRVEQRAFDAIPGAPWVYWLPESLRRLFETLPRLGNVAQPVVGLRTSDNFRFLRYWWEVGRECIGFRCHDRAEARAGGRRWFPYMKGGAYRKWYGNQEHVVNWLADGREVGQAIMDAYPYLGRPWLGGIDYYFREGVTWSKVTSGGFSVRYTPPGFVFDVAGTSVFPPQGKVFHIAGVLNSNLIAAILRHISPTINYEVGHIASLPLRPEIADETTANLAHRCTHVKMWEATTDETTFDFLAPPRWDTGLEDLAAAQARLAALEAQIDEEVYRLYGISAEDRALIEAELAGGPPGEDEETEGETGDTEETEPEPPLAPRELAVRWIAYAVGIVLGRFQPGLPGALGSAIYRREDFALGSLPAPDGAEFDALVGPAERFAYVDADGGRHLFPAAVEGALGALALPDGIAVLDAGHPRDLPALVESALRLMLDGNADTEHATPNTDALIEVGAGGDLRRFLERDFFTQWHFKWYRQRPVYWPLQSARRSYGFVLFHERVGRDILYALQRDYLDYRINGLRLQIGDLEARRENLSGRARKEVERQIDQAAQLLDELNEFAATMDRLARAGYEPEPDWIDDGIILRLAPLWEIVPLWKSEPQKYWERLQAGQFDWSHIAMRYWPERVRQKCRTNKSYAIAHGHEEWYVGG